MTHRPHKAAPSRGSPRNVAATSLVEHPRNVADSEAAGLFYRVEVLANGNGARRGTSGAIDEMDHHQPSTESIAMLRISIVENAANAATLHLEGQVAGPWAAELGTACEHLLTDGRRLVLDLGDVMLIDRPGLALLADLSHRSVALVHCSPFQEEQLRQAATNFAPNSALP